MDEKLNIEEMLPRLLQALEAVTAKVDEMDARINELDSVLYDGVIGPANEAIAQQEYDTALSDFRCKYAEKLGPYENACKSVEGDDFDMYKAAFDGYNEGEFDFSPDEYVDKLAVKLQDQIARIKEAVAESAGVEPEDVEVEVDAKDGEVQVDVDNTTTEEKPEDNEKVEVEAAAIEPDEENEEKDNEESLEDFEQSLRDSIKDGEKLLKL